MTISLRSNVDNSWANAQIALINESTNEEIYANKDIEYYSGYTDGESWAKEAKEANLIFVGWAKENTTWWLRHKNSLMIPKIIPCM